jgi:DNA-directed RNA polymerase specialized sigma24 family protein
MISKPGTQTLEDLLLIISYKNEDLPAARKAFSELHNRYSKYLYYICGKFTLSRASDAEMQESILNDVFVAVYENADNLLEYKRGIDENEKDLMFKAWLVKTAKSFFDKILKEYSEKFITIETTDEENPFKQSENNPTRLPRFISYSVIEESLAAGEPVVPFNSEERNRLDLAIDKLSAKERDITLTYLNLEDEHGHIPRYIREALAFEHGMLPESVRKTKQRTVKKLKSILNP